jgi:hypothetical protein
VAALGAQEWQVDLAKGLKSAIVAKDERAAGGRCIVADVSQAAGTAFEALTPDLAPGVYEATLRLKLPAINSVNTAPLKWVFEVGAAGAGKCEFDVLRIEEAGVYQPIPCRFIVRQAGRARVALAWRRQALNPERSASMRVEKQDLPKAPELDLLKEEQSETKDELALEAEISAEPPLGGLRYLYLAVEGIVIRSVSDAEICALAPDKIRYQPGEQATIAVGVRNYAAAPRSWRVETELVRELDRVIPVDSRNLDIGPGAEQTFQCATPPLTDLWGYAVRCRLFEGERTLAEGQEFFTVHSNLWAVLQAGSPPAQFTAQITPENAAAAAERNRRRYRNWVESGFWAPDEFGDFTPATERWWGGQGCYYGSVAGTRAMIAEGHKRGMSFAVYALIWGGDGPPAFETVRRHPDWGYPSTFNVEWLERWERNAMGTGSNKAAMHVWPLTIIDHSAAGAPARHHGRELSVAHRDLGWDAVRYDCHAISDENARLMRLVKETVHAEAPAFQFGYNSSVPQGDPRLGAAFKAQCEGEGGIMEEGIRQFGGGGLSFAGGATYAVFARRLLDFKNEARTAGGHFIAIGLDKCYPNDLVYQYIFWLAGNSHPCYDWRDASVADYAQFATRYAGLLWDLRLTPLREPAKWIDVGAAESFLWWWRDFVQQRALDGGRRQIVIHLINAPAETVLYTHDDAKVPPPRRDIPLALRVPDGAQVRGVWFLTPEYELTRTALPVTVADGRARFTVPRLRFWSMAVVELDHAETAL